MRLSISIKTARQQRNQTKEGGRRRAKNMRKKQRTHKTLCFRVVHKDHISEQQVPEGCKHKVKIARSVALVW